MNDRLDQSKFMNTADVSTMVRVPEGKTLSL